MRTSVRAVVSKYDDRCVNETTLAGLVARGLSGRAIAAELGCSLGTVRHWLKVFGLQTRATIRRRHLAEARASGEVEISVWCMRCGPAPHRLFPGRGLICLRCRAQAVARRRRKVKAILVDEAGGCCRLCGFAGSLAALQFHHLDPTTKEFHIGHRGLSRSIARARAEAAKCILLCANCHAAVEAGDAAVP